MNIFDIMGPIMVGPSSSHTAGAARMGRVARHLLGLNLEPQSRGTIGTMYHRLLLDRFFPLQPEGDGTLQIIEVILVAAHGLFGIIGELGDRSAVDVL